MLKIINNKDCANRGTMYCGHIFHSCLVHPWHKILACVHKIYTDRQEEFSVPRIEYPLEGSSKIGSHVYFLLQVFWVILLFCHKCCADVPW